LIRGGSLQRRLGINGILGIGFHFNIAVGHRPHAPFRRSGTVPGKEVQGRRVNRVINSFKAGTAQHDVQPMVPHIIPDALPKKLNHRLCPVLFQDTGSSKLQKFQRGFCRQQWRSRIRWV
jgi:hypothetical protein